MIQKIKMILISLGIVSTLGLLPAAVVHATAASDACAGIKLVDPDAKCNNADKGQEGFRDLIRKVITIFSIVIGSVSVIMIIFGGFRYVVSGGDSSATKSAKDTIMYAVIGLVVVLFAQVIVAFVLTNANAPAETATPKTATPK